MQCEVKTLHFMSLKIEMSFRFMTWIFSYVQMEHGCQGLERADVAKFPTKKYSDKFFAAAENSQYVHIFF